jgi:hypothetical protein
VSKLISLLLGLALLALGVWGGYVWWPEVLGFLQAVVVVVAVLVGLGVFVFALSELRPEDQVRAPTPPAPPLPNDPGSTA